MPGVPSLALGSGEVTLMAMTAAYGAFANQGIVPAPALIRRVAGDCVRRVALSRRIRLFGVRVGGLVRADAVASVAREPSPSTAKLFD